MRKFWPMKTMPYRDIKRKITLVKVIIGKLCYRQKLNDNSIFIVKSIQNTNFEMILVNIKRGISSKILSIGYQTNQDIKGDYQAFTSGNFLKRKTHQQQTSHHKFYINIQKIKIFLCIKNTISKSPLGPVYICQPSKIFG